MTSIDPLYVLRGASTTNYFHHKFCVLHCPLIARLKLKRQRALVVHRIDRFASGALLFAKTCPDRDALVRQFLDHTPVRRYLAALRGRLGVEAGTLVHYFRREGMHQQLRTARDPGRLVPNFDIPSNALLRMLRSSGLSWSQDCRIRSGHNLRRSATRLSATENITGQNRRNS